MKKIYLILVCLFTIGTVGAQKKTEQRYSEVNDTLKAKTALYTAIQAADISAGNNYMTVPSTPQSQVFERYLNHAITEYHGLPTIEIPLHELQIKGATIPITLSYHAGGIKYKQYDGEIGAGWSIGACGYRVSRTIKNRPDERSVFYDKNHLSNLYDQPVKEQYLGGMVQINPNVLYDHGGANGTAQYYDGEYDQFMYLTPTTNAHFIITERSQTQGFKTAILEHNNDKLSVNGTVPAGSLGGSITDLTLKDTQGIDYSFGGTGYNELNVFSEWQYRTAPVGWTLKKMRTPQGDEANFTYEPLTIINDPVRGDIFTLTDAFQWSGPGAGGTDFAQFKYERREESWQNILFIKKIETDYEKVEFTRSTEMYYKHLLKKIVITNKITQDTKTISFNHKLLNGHQLLTSVDIAVSGISGTVKKHSFGYYEPSSLMNSGVYPDQWGYYTYANSTMFYTLHDEFRNCQFYNQFTSGGGSWNPAPHTIGNYFNYWRNRSGDPGTMNATHLFSLREITFPTGGTTTYEYELNQYYNVEKGRNVKGGGQRIRQIISDAKDGSPLVTTEFRYGNNEDGNGVPTFPLEWKAFGDEIVQTSALSNIQPYTMIRTFSSAPSGDATQGQFRIVYPQVSVYQYDAENRSYNGKTVSNYYIHTQYGAEPMPSSYVLGDFYRVSNYITPWNVTHYRIGYKPELWSRLVYNKQNELIQQEEYRYISNNTDAPRQYEGLIVQQKARVMNNPYFPGVSSPIVPTPNDFVDALYATQPVTYDIGGYRIPEEKITTTYFPDGSSSAIKETYTYDNKNRLTTYIKNRVNEHSKTLKEEYTYPVTNSELAIKNIIFNPIETVKRIGSSPVQHQKYHYANNSIYPYQLETLEGRIAVTYDKYDTKGNLLQYTRADGTTVSIIWSYKQLYPVAIIEGKTYTQVESALSNLQLTTTGLAGLSIPDSNTISKLRQLRERLPDALVTIYTYEPLTGLASETSPAGIVQEYTYDKLSRLKEINLLDGSTKRKIETYDYNYKHK